MDSIKCIECSRLSFSVINKREWEQKKKRGNFHWIVEFCNNFAHTVSTPMQTKVTRMTKTLLFSDKIPGKWCECKHKGGTCFQTQQELKTTSTTEERRFFFSAPTSVLDCRKLIEIWCCDGKRGRESMCMAKTARNERSKLNAR